MTIKPPQGVESAPQDLSLAELRKPFQRAVAGTFYKTMLKSLRDGERKPAYMHGGTSEDIFRSRLDDQLSEIMAESHGDAFTRPLFERMAQEFTGKQTPELFTSSSPLSPLLSSHTHVDALA